MEIVIDILNIAIERLGVLNMYLLAQWTFGALLAMSENKNRCKNGFIFMLSSIFLAIIFK